MPRSGLLDAIMLRDRRGIETVGDYEIVEKMSKSNKSIGGALSEFHSFLYSQAYSLSFFDKVRQGVYREVRAE